MQYGVYRFKNWGISFSLAYLIIPLSLLLFPQLLPFQQLRLLQTLLILIIFILTWSPGFVFGIKVTKPCIRAIPSPLRLVSWTSTSYSFPISTGFGGNLPSPLHLNPRLGPKLLLSSILFTSHFVHKMLFRGLLNCQCSVFSHV